jgi:hypothetical protein
MNPQLSTYIKSFILTVSVLKPTQIEHAKLADQLIQYPLRKASCQVSKKYHTESLWTLNFFMCNTNNQD